jgi:hypothetical protein
MKKQYLALFFHGISHFAQGGEQTIKGIYKSALTNGNVTVGLDHLSIKSFDYRDPLTLSRLLTLKNN